MQRQLQKGLRTGRSKYLAGSRAISNRLVVSHRRVVTVPGGLQCRGRVFVAQQPVHPDAGTFAGHRRHLRFLFRSLHRVMPGVDSVYPNFTAMALQNSSLRVQVGCAIR